MSERMKLSGSMVAIVTPFAGGEVDYDCLGQLIEFQLDGGTQGIIPCGTTGESPTLTPDEHAKVIAFTCEKVAGRAVVIPGTGSNSTAEAIALTRHAKSAGADACLIVNPYYNKPTQHGMVAHIEAIAAVDLPIVLYNIPGRTGVKLTPETIVSMYESIPQVVAVKDATGDLDMASAVSSACDISILSGDDSLTLPMAAVGGTGVISVLANLLPAEVRKLTDAIAADDLPAARAQHLKLFPLFRGMFAETNPIPIKAAMAMAGMIQNELRLPMTPLSAQYEPALRTLLTSAGVDVK